MNLEQTKLTLERLNELWSFTGSILSHRVPLLLRRRDADPVADLLHGVTAYGCLAGYAGNALAYGATPDAHWERLFRSCGQNLFFTLPESLTFFEKSEVQKNISNAFMTGWRLAPHPYPLP